jgi:small subunit ribosomal protein S2
MQIALGVIYETVKKNGKILFVSTKVQASDIIAEYAEKCGQYYVNHRWLGGMLTNWGTISGSIKKLDNLEKVLGNEEEYSGYTKKEILEMTRKKDKLLKSLGGIRHIGTRPNLLVIIDTNKEHLAIQEAVKLGIPIIAIVDTNSNPDNIDHPVPGNDDAIRSIRLYCTLFADAALAGIEEALAASGVDLGSIATHEEKGTNIKGVTKLKSTKKFSKTPNLNNQEALESEFETALELAEVATTTKQLVYCS